MPYFTICVTELSNSPLWFPQLYRYCIIEAKCKQSGALMRWLKDTMMFHGPRRSQLGKKPLYRAKKPSERHVWNKGKTNTLKTHFISLSSDDHTNVLSRLFLLTGTLKSVTLRADLDILNDYIIKYSFRMQNSNKHSKALLHSNRTVFLRI